MLLLHLSYSYTTLNYHFYLLLFFGMLLLVRLELSRRQQFWQTSGLAVQGQVVRNVVIDQCRRDRAGADVARQGPAEQPSELMDPVWSQLPGRLAARPEPHRPAVRRGAGAAGGRGRAGVRQHDAAARQLRAWDGTCLKIESPRARYWRTMSYAVYTGQGMVSGDVYGDRFEANAPLTDPVRRRRGPRGDRAADHRPGEPVESGLRVRQPDPRRPADARRVARRRRKTRPWSGWRRCCARARSTPSSRRSPYASEDQLRQAGTQYPPGIEKYLQLPPIGPRAGPGRTPRRSRPPGTTPYDKALAVEACLRTLPYETKVPTPPSDRDWVDYTLFDVQTGYADSLATSMTVMLREVGVPARVVTGFRARARSTRTRRAYMIYESEAHAWVEVFFPKLRLDQLRAERPPRPAVPPDRGRRDRTCRSRTGAYLGDSPDMYMDDPYFDSFGDYVPYVDAARGRAVAHRVRRRGRHCSLRWWPPGSGMMVLLRRGLRGLPWHAQWYGQFRRLAGWAGLAGRASQTPFEYTEWLERRYPGTGKMVRPITECYVQGAYSGQEPGPEELARASKAWDNLRRPLARRVFLRGVIAARERFEELRDEQRERLNATARSLTPRRPSSTMRRYDR